MGLRDRIVRALALRWLRGKLGKWAKGGGAMWQWMSGKKGKWFAIAFVIVGLVKFFTGTDISAFLEIGIKSAGMSDPGLIADAQAFATEWVPMIAALVVALHGIYKHWRERKAGATLAEVGSLAGQAKRAIAEGVVKTLGDDALVVAGVAVDAKKA